MLSSLAHDPLPDPTMLSQQEESSLMSAGDAWFVHTGPSLRMDREEFSTYFFLCLSLLFPESSSTAHLVATGPGVAVAHATQRQSSQQVAEGCPERTPCSTLGRKLGFCPTSPEGRQGASWVHNKRRGVQSR